MTHHDEHEQQTEPTEDPLQREQEGKGYGADRGEREEAVGDREPPAPRRRARLGRARRKPARAEVAVELRQSAHAVVEDGVVDLVGTDRFQIRRLTVPGILEPEDGQAGLVGQTRR
jgi:hypothetical protein